MPELYPVVSSSDPPEHAPLEGGSQAAFAFTVLPPLVLVAIVSSRLAVSHPWVVRGIAAASLAFGAWLAWLLQHQHESGCHCMCSHVTVWGVFGPRIIDHYEAADFIRDRVLAAGTLVAGIFGLVHARPVRLGWKVRS